MPRYKLLNGTHTVNGIVFEKGDEIDVSEEHVSRFGGERRFSLIAPVMPVPSNDHIPPPEDGKEKKDNISASQARAAMAASESVEEEITIADLLLKSLSDIKTQLATVNDTETIDVVLAEEKNGKHRADVLKVIEARRKAIKG